VSAVTKDTDLSQEMATLESLRAHRRRYRAFLQRSDLTSHLQATGQFTVGQKISDWVASTVGSWIFIVFQTSAIAVWIAYNYTADSPWDPYPFILLNLLLSFQAAYTAPMIMMSQNRQARIDRQNAQNDFEVNVKAELEIELLHQKIDLLKQKELLELAQAIRDLGQRLDK
jgi:uncharacterized membrane protein